MLGSHEGGRCAVFLGREVLFIMGFSLQLT
jgi:hypothetical protein